MTKKAGVLISGCGALTGSDPYETAYFSSSLERAGFEITFLSPSKKSILFKSIEISKGKVYSFQDVSPNVFDVIVIPGGQGVIWNLHDSRGKPRKEVQNFLREFHLKKGIIVAISVGVTLLSRVFPEYNFDFDLLQLKSGSYLVNKEYRIIVSPGSISCSSPSTLEKEIESVVKEIDLFFK